MFKKSNVVQSEKHTTKTNTELSKKNKMTFWLFNIANAICTLYIVVCVYINMCDNNPSAAFNISSIALFQAMFALMLNVLLHKATKDKEVFLDD